MGELTDQAHDLALFPRLERLECLLLGFLRRQRVALGKLHAFFGQSHNLVLTTALGKNSNVASPRALSVLIAELMVCLL